MIGNMSSFLKVRLLWNATSAVHVALSAVWCALHTVFEIGQKHEVKKCPTAKP